MKKSTLLILTITILASFSISAATLLKDSDLLLKYNNQIEKVISNSINEEVSRLEIVRVDDSIRTNAFFSSNPSKCYGILFKEITINGLEKLMVSNISRDPNCDQK